MDFEGRNNQDDPGSTLLLRPYRRKRELVVREKRLRRPQASQEIGSGVKSKKRKKKTEMPSSACKSPKRPSRKKTEMPSSACKSPKRPSRKKSELPSSAPTLATRQIRHFLRRSLRCRTAPQFVTITVAAPCPALTFVVLAGNLTHVGKHLVSLDHNGSKVFICLEDIAGVAFTSVVRSETLPVPPEIQCRDESPCKREMRHILTRLVGSQILLSGSGFGPLKVVAVHPGLLILERGTVTPSTILWSMHFLGGFQVVSQD